MKRNLLSKLIFSAIFSLPLWGFGQTEALWSELATLTLNRDQLVKSWMSEDEGYSVVHYQSKDLKLKIEELENYFKNSEHTYSSYQKKSRALDQRIIEWLDDEAGSEAIVKTRLENLKKITEKIEKVESLLKQR